MRTVCEVLWVGWLAASLGAATTAELKKKGLELMEGGRVKEAIATFRQALSSAPRDFEILNDLGVALRKDGDLEGSLSSLRAAVVVRPNDARIHNNVALTLR